MSLSSVGCVNHQKIWPGSVIRKDAIVEKTVPDVFRADVTKADTFDETALAGGGDEPELGGEEEEDGGGGGGGDDDDDEEKERRLDASLYLCCFSKALL